jgi:hypothetical protein
MTKTQIKHMVDRFLGWRLPDNFNPDGGVSFKKTFNEHTTHQMKYEPFGTNLLDAIQAEDMVRYMLDGLPADTFAWLIEAPGPSYLAVREINLAHDFVWTRDHALALQFADERQADMAMMAIRRIFPDLFAFERTLGNARPVEHGWTGTAAR